MKNIIIVLWIKGNKYHYIAVTKPNALWSKFLSNHDGDEFV